MRNISWLLSLAMFGTVGCDRISIGDLGDLGDAGREDAPDLRTDAAAPIPDANTPPSIDVRVDGAPICPSDFSWFLPLVTPTSCPAARPTELRPPCDLPENSICVWQNTNGFDACGCYAVIDGKSWKCWGSGGSATSCPTSAPAEGSSCAGQQHGDSCNYPFLSCTCSLGTWGCRNDSFFAPREVVRACPPDGIDESKLVKDLTDEEAVAWCQWYGDPTGRPRPPINPNFPADDTTGYAYTWMNDLWGGGLDGCFVELPVEYCVRNLRYQSCNAPLRELDDCLESMRRTGSANAIVGFGCGPYYRNATCDRTIVQRTKDVSGGCKVPLK